MSKIGVVFFFLFSSFASVCQTVDFTYQTSDGLFCNPAIVEFSATASQTPKAFIWNFGNGTITNGQDAEVVFSKAGTYNVKLIAVYANNAVTTTKQITVNPVVTANLKADRNFICTPGAIKFLAPATGVSTTYYWDFGDGSGPVTAFSDTISHFFSAKQDYDVKLKVVDSSGCFDTTSIQVSLKDPLVSGTASPRSGCMPAPVTFTTESEIPPRSSVANIVWNFGDGDSFSTNATSTTTHTYSDTKSHSPSVTIRTDEGCTATFNYPTVALGTPPTNPEAYPFKTVICGSETAQFVSKATKANAYIWNFGDGTGTTVSDTLVEHKFKTLGIKNVTATPAFNGCRGTPVTFQIEVVGVIAAYNYSNICTEKNTFSFTNKSQGNLSHITWNFGDGSPEDSTLNVTHTFPTSDVSTTTLIVKDDSTGCSDTTARVIYTAEPILTNADSSLCRNSQTSFAILNTYDNPSVTYTWHVVGAITGALKDTGYTRLTNKLGNFDNFVIINNGSGYCKDTVYLDHKILVRGPDLSFTSSPAICFDSLFSVKNTSKPFIPADSIVSWHWNFGAGTVSYDVYQPEPFSYNKYGKYNVKLIATDINGCTDSLTKPVTINPLPFVQTIPALDTLCAGTADTLIAFHNNQLTWTSASNLSCETCDTVLASPSVSTKFYAIATNTYGCTYRDSVMVMVYNPFTARSPEPNPYICQTDTVVLKVEPPMKQIVWSPSEGLSNPSGYNPSVVPLANTTYTATLTDSVGCFTGSVSINVHVKSLPTVDAGADTSYPYNAPFSIHPTYSSNIVSYTWTPSSSLSCTTCAFPDGITSKSETYHIKVASDSSCIAEDSITIFVQCKESYILMPTAFTPNNDGLNDYYYPITRGIKTIRKFTIYNRLGQVVFEARDFSPNEKSFGWNGQLKSKDQNSSVFVYVIEALCDQGETVYKKGSFVLIR